MAVSTAIREAEDPAEAWLRWYEAATAAWGDAVRGDSRGYAYPFTLYRHWIQGFESAQAPSSEAATQATPSTGGLWKEWFETVAAAWETRVKAVEALWGLTTQWTETIGSLQLATRPYVARLAEEVAALEATLDRLGRELRELSDNDARLIEGARAQGEALQRVDRGLAQLQGAPGDRDQLAHRLEQIERQLDQMKAASGQVQSTLQRLLLSAERSMAATSTEAKEGQADERKGTAKRTPTGASPAEQA